MSMTKIKNASNKRPKWGKKLIRMAKDELDSTLCCGAPQCRHVEICISGKTAFSVGMFLQSPASFLFLFMVLLDGAAAHWMCSTAINGHEDVLRLTKHWRLASDRWCSTQPNKKLSQFFFLLRSWISLVPEVKRTYEILTSSVSTENSVIPVSRVPQDSYPSAPGALNPSESSCSPTNFASTTEGIIESGQYKGKTLPFLYFAAAFCAFFSPPHLSLPLNIAQTKQLFVAFVLFVFFLCLYF